MRWLALFLLVPSIASAGQFQNFPFNPVGRQLMFAGFHFNEGSGSTLLDVSTNTQTATFTGTGQTFVNGLWGTALSLNGNGGAQMPALTFDIVSDVTMFAWIRWNGGAGTRQTIFGRSTPAVSNWVFSVFNFKFESNISFDTQGQVISTVDVATKTWTAVCFVRRNCDRMEIWINGQLNKYLPADCATLNDVVVPCIGGGSACTGNFFNGDIEDLVVYERALSPAEIVYLSNGNRRTRNSGGAGNY